ncbi:MAG TPA: MOSC N-terminal beta barrel domain-containing protein [Candidatus Binataceae bacterium]
MSEQVIGTIEELWRYPVKSMLGERLHSVMATIAGLTGDRAWALRDLRTGNIVSAKKWARMFEFSASYEGAPAGGEPGRVRIELPDQTSLYADDPWASRAISEVLGFEVRLERAAALEDKRVEADIDTDTVFGDVPVNQIYTGLKPGQNIPSSFGLPRGTFFDASVIHIVSSASMERLRELQGGSVVLSSQRFRPNVFIRTTAGLTGFVEDEWLAGPTLAIGGLRVDKIKPTLRCVMTTHAQPGLPRDLSVLRTAAQHHTAHLGVTGRIVNEALLEVGQPVTLIK